MDRPGTEAGARRARQRLEVDHVGAVAVLPQVAGHRVGLPRLLVAHEAQQLRRRALVAQPQRRAVEAANRRLFRNAAADPGRPAVLGLDERELVAVRAGEAQPLRAEARVLDEPSRALHGEARAPERQRALRHREDGLPDLAGALVPAGDVRKGKVGHHRAGRAVLVAVVEVVDLRRIEVHRLLDPAQAERVGEEGIVGPRVRRHRRDVVQALDLGQHGVLPVRVPGRYRGPRHESRLRQGGLIVAAGETIRRAELGFSACRSGPRSSPSARAAPPSRRRSGG